MKPRNLIEIRIEIYSIVLELREHAKRQKTEGRAQLEDAAEKLSDALKDIANEK